MPAFILSGLITFVSILSVVFSLYKMKELAEETVFNKEDSSVKESILMFVYAGGASFGVLGFFVGMSIEMMRLGVGV